MNTGASSSFEVKGVGRSSSKWFEAEKTSSGTFALTTKGARDMKNAEKKAASGGDGGGGGGC